MRRPTPSRQEYSGADRAPAPARRLAPSRPRHGPAAKELLRTPAVACRVGQSVLILASGSCICPTSKTSAARAAPAGCGCPTPPPLGTGRSVSSRPDGTSSPARTRAQCNGSSCRTTWSCPTGEFPRRLGPWRSTSSDRHPRPTKKIASGQRRASPLCQGHDRRVKNRSRGYARSPATAATANGVGGGPLPWFAVLRDRCPLTSNPQRLASARAGRRFEGSQDLRRWP